MSVVLIILFVIGVVSIDRERRARAHVYDARPKLRRGDYIGPDWYAEREQS